jgi:hypothetical protein
MKYYSAIIFHTTPRRAKEEKQYSGMTRISCISTRNPAFDHGYHQDRI